MKELGRKRWKQRNKAQPAVDEGGMGLLHFLLSAEAQHIANRRCECLRHTYKTGYAAFHTLPTSHSTTRIHCRVIQAGSS